MQKNRIWILLFILLVFPFVSANGLTITSNTSVDITKIQDQNVFIDITIKNDEPFNFYNITSDNNILSFDKFDLNSGEEKKFSAKITTNDNFDSDITFNGEYESNLGALNNTYDIEVNYDTGLDVCDLTIVKGDTINWVNNVPDEIKLRDYNTGNDIKKVNENENYSLKFDNPGKLKYYVLRIGHSFTDVCEITILDDEGFITNPDYETSMNLKLNINYKPTTVSLNFLNSYYSMNFNDVKEDIFSITNTGNYDAKNVKLKAQWVTFDTNNFNLPAGESRNIGYTITPYIAGTNQTNRTYLINLTATGNFNTTSKQLSLFIKHANINENYSNYSINKDVIAYMIKSYCEDYPDEDICKPTVIYRNNNHSDEVVTMNMTKEQLNELWEYEFEQSDQRKVYENYMKEIMDNQNLTMQQIKDKIEQTKQNYEDLSKTIDDRNSVMIFVGIFFGFIFILGILLFLIFNKGIISRIKNKARFHKGEML